MSRVPFKQTDVQIVPDEFVSGVVLERLHQEFQRTSTWPYGYTDMLDDWKHGQLLMAGVFETRRIFAHAKCNSDWHLQTFAKPGAPWSIFFAVVAVSLEGTPESGWVSPAVDATRAGWIRKTLDPNSLAQWSGAE